jgi:tetratricopeptide (TPR) repeat protein
VLHQGYYLKAYGFLRDAVQVAHIGPVRPIFSSAHQQLLNAYLNCGTAARLLGRHHFALHEFSFLIECITDIQEIEPLLLERMSGCYLALKDHSLAERYADAAIAKAKQKPEEPFIGHIYYNRARVAIYKSDAKTAAVYFKKAYDSFKSVDCLNECALVLNSLSQCYVTLKRFQSARRSANAALRIADQLKRYRSRAASLMLLGIVDAADNRGRSAKNKWQEAVQIAKRLKDTELRFKAEFLLYKQALRNHNAAVARAISRRLQRLAPSIPVEIDEVDEFRQLASGITPPEQHSVSVVQRDIPTPGN